MARITLIRHGQASFGQANYDQLSERGYRQGELVGQALATRGIKPDLILCGSMSRHRQTLESAQKHWSQEQSFDVDTNFNEFDSDDVIAVSHAQFSTKADLVSWVRSQPKPMQAFQLLFEEAIQTWIQASEQQASAYKESWPGFKQRCQQGLLNLINNTSHQEIVIFTSGGPITILAQYCLQLTDQKAFDLNWTLYNASISQILFNRQDKISLSSANEHHHLVAEDPSFLTYR